VTGTLIRRVAVWVGLAILVLAFGAQLTATGKPNREGALSVDPKGRLAALQLLQDSGRHVVPWKQAPLHLAEMDALLLIGEDVELQSSASGERSSLDPRSGRHYHDFLTAGGRAIIDVRAIDWLRSEVGLDIGEARHPSPDTFQPLHAPSGEELDANLESTVGLPITVEGEAGEVLLADRDGAPFASLFAVGSGALLLVGDTDLWRNEHLAEEDHAYLLLALTGMLGGNRTILFDEFSRGYYAPPGFLSLSLSGRMAPLGWALLLWMALASTAVVWTWRFARDPRQQDTIHPFTRVSAGAHLLDRARGPVIVAGRLRTGVLKLLAHRLRLGPEESDNVADATLRRAPDQQAAERWREVLTAKLPSKQAPLENWAQELRTIERAVEASLRRDSRRGAGPQSRTKHG